MKQITDIENIIKLLTEEPDMVPNPPGTEGESTTMELTDFQKLMGLKKGTLDSEVFDDDYYPKYTSIVYEIDDQYIYVDLEKGERGSTSPAETMDMEEWDFDILRDMVEDRWHNTDYEPFDCYNANEEWVEGYAFTALSPKNVSLLADWFEIVSPQLAQKTKELLKKDPNLDNRDMHGEWQEVGTQMMDTALGGKLIESILDEYCGAINPAMINATAIDVRKEWETLKKKYGGGEWWDTDEIVTFEIPIEDMIYIYYKTNKYKGTDTIEEVIESMFEDIGSNFGNMSEWWWESNYYPEFTENYNKYVTPLLLHQIEKLEDVDKIEEIREINKKLDDYQLGMDQQIKPKGAPYEMRIQGFDPKSLTFDVRVSPVKGYMKTGKEDNLLKDPVSGEEMGWYTYRVVRMTVDDIINKVVNPELQIDGTGYYFPAFGSEVIKEEKLKQQDREVEINKFIGFCKDELDINELPPVTLRYEKKGGEGNSDITTTAYQSKDQGVHVYIKDRALVDVLRSIAHELVHHHQLERDEEYYWKHIEDNPGIQSGTDLEDEANARAGSLIKDWGLVHGNNQIYEGRFIQEHRLLLHPASFRDRLAGEKETILNVEVEVLYKYLNKRREELKEKFRPLLEEIKFMEHTIEERVEDGEYKNRDEWWEENTNQMGGSPYDEMMHELEGVEADLERLGILSDWRTGMNYEVNEWLEDLIKEIDDDFYITEDGAVELEYLNMGGSPIEEDLTNWAYDGEKIGPIKEGMDYEPFTKAEVSIMNKISSKFTYDELKEIADNGDFTASALAKKYKSLVKLFGVNNTSKAQAMDYGRIWAQWIVDNWDEHIGNVVSPDFSSLIGKEGNGKAYLDEYEVEGEEDVWEKAYRQGSVYMYGFDDDQVTDYAHDYFYDYDPDMETVDWGDADQDDFRIGNVNRLGNSLRINDLPPVMEQSIDISEIPAEDLSPELEVGDRVYGWDLRDDGDEEPDMVPNQIIGNVVNIEEDDAWPKEGGFPKPDVSYIYYDIETIDGDNVALYPDDKYIKLPKKQLNEQEVEEDLETKVFRFIRPIDIEKALSQKEIQKVLKSLGLKYDMFDTLDINLENDMVQDLRNQIRFDNFYKRMIAASDIRGGTWEGLFAGLFNGKVVAGQKGVGKADVETPEGGWSLKFVANKNESPTLGSLKTQLQKVKEEGLVPEDASIYSIFSTPDSQTSSELFEAKHQILDSAFEGVNFIAVAYPLPQQNTIIMHFTDMDNLKDFIIDTENPPINKPKSGPEAFGELRLSSRGWKSFPFLQITFPEATQEKYQEYLKKYPREQEIEGVFGKYGGKIPPEVLTYLRKNPQTIINRLKGIPGYEKYFTEQFISSAEYLTQNANERLKSFKKFLMEKCNMKDIPTTVGFRPREAWEDGLMDIFSRCWFKSTSKGIEAGFGNLADKTFEMFPVDEFPAVKEKVDEIFNTSKKVYDYLFPPKDQDTKYSLRNMAQEDAAEILYNDVKELVEEAELIEQSVKSSTEEEHLKNLEEIRNRVELILNIFTSSFGEPVKRRLGFFPKGK